MTGLDGVLAGEPARVWRGGDGVLRLDWRGRELHLGRELGRHRDDGGEVEFRAGGEAARYRRPGPSESDLHWDAIDVGADEPWTWEDADFGLFVFHVATGTGPVKYRHALGPAPAGPPGGLAIGDDGLARRVAGLRPQAARWDTLREVRAKFEVAGVWAAPTVLVLDAGDDLAVLPVDHPRGPDRVRAELLPRLRRLPGWQDEPLEVALEYAVRDPLGPREGETRDDWAERPVWSRPADG